MCRTLLWLSLASLALCSLNSLADGAHLLVLSAPNLLRVGTAENIFVESQDHTGGAELSVVIKVMNHPAKTKILATATIKLNRQNHYQALGKITIPAGDFQKDPNIKQYVYLQANFPERTLEKVVLISFQSGYIFIQTDKTLYTPNSVVNYRMFAVTPGMEPVERNDEVQNDASISIDIVTPEGFVLPMDTVSLQAGIHSGKHPLPEIISDGLWKIVARFHNNPQESYSAEFEVKEYVLPSFEVKLTPQTAFFYVDSNELVVNIRATYLFGEAVDGTAYVVFGFIQEGARKSFPRSLQRIPIQRGAGVATLTNEQITQTFNIHELVKSSIFVAVSVLTENGGEMVEAELRGIQIVTSPYTIHFKKTPKYFKPGMSFDVTMYVTNPDDTPAQGVQVLVDPGNVAGITGESGLAKLTINTAAGAQRLAINARTDDPDIRQDRQASATMTAQPYATSSNNYIHIGVDSADVKIGQNLKVNLNLNRLATNLNHDITYLILSRGQIVKSGRFRREGQLLVTLSMPVTKEMLPSFRIVAYYHVGAAEMVSDSVWVDVKDTCMGSLKLESTRPVAAYEPHKMFGLKITGDPEATVGLVAVDKGVYVLNNKHRLTQTKVWNIVEQYDTGCTPGGGRNSMGVFYDAGLVLQTSILTTRTADRLDLKCPVSARKRRATTIMEVRTTLASQYDNKLQRDCCVAGMSPSPLSYDCARRSEDIEDGAACIEAFVHCCNELTTQQAEMKQDTLHLAGSEEDDKSYMDSNEIVPRTKFPESWLWLDIVLPKCPVDTPNCDTTSLERYVPLQDSITTWQLTAISLSRTHGICVADPFEIITRKDFFIDLRVPYSAVRGEQLEIKAILHNHSPYPATVRVDLLEEEHVCSSASKRRRYRQEVNVGASSTRVVPFIVIPMKDGLLPIEVKAAVKDSHLNDGIRKMLLVVPEGVLIKDSRNVTLDPSKHNGEQVEIINSGIPKTDRVPDTPAITQISVTGGQQISPLVESVITGNSMNSLIYQPRGCGEQNMIHMTLPVIATTYLDRTTQWELIGFEKRNEALQHITTGYHNQQAYNQGDGSYAVWAKKHKSSTWLTAYVVKVFAMASDLVAIDTNVLCGAVEWLILRTQQRDGIFREVGKVYHKEMTGYVFGSDSEVSMTAFVLIAMQEARRWCSDTVNSLPGSIDKAVSYLEGRLPLLNNPYAVAMTSYALANEGKFNQETLYNFASREFTHWPVPSGHVYTLEATAYALLALVKAQAFDEASPVVRWFNKQRKVGGGFGSTQATMIVYQAVSEYWISAKEAEYDLNVDILLPGMSRPDRFNFNSQNFFRTRSSKLNDINQDVKVTATGTGEATLTMVSLYYALPKEKESDCKKFNLSVQLIPEKEQDDERTYKLMIEILYLDRDKDATMTILDIGLLTGFTPDTRDLDTLYQGPARTIAKYEMNTALSERGSLIIYLDKVSHRRPDEVAFRVTQKMKVGVLQPAAVSVYEYYDQTPCVKFYHPERKQGHLLRLCQSEVCSCAEENCSLQKKGKIDNAERTTKVCENDVNSTIYYVYKVRMENFEDALSTDIYMMRIEEAIKEGSYDMGVVGKLRKYLSYTHCREALSLGVGKTYLIMGTERDMHRDDQDGYQYVLGERTWIEYWPSGAECQTDQYRPTCLGIEEMVSQYPLFACPN